MALNAVDSLQNKQTLFFFGAVLGLLEIEQRAERSYCPLPHLPQQLPLLLTSSTRVAYLLLIKSTLICYH